MMRRKMPKNNFERLLEETFISEAKASKIGIDIGDGFSVHKVGFDKNGNWSYWISKGRSKQKKVQVVGNVKGSKITDVNAFKTAPKETISSLKAYANEYLNI